MKILLSHQDEESNTFQFNKDKAKDNTGLHFLMSENQYFSHDILSEQERLIVLDARRTLVEEINSNNFFSIICDEASDISKPEQLSFSIRSCNNSYETFESFIGILSCDQGLTSAALLMYIQDILLRCNMNTRKLVGTAFDGASSMERLAALMKKHFGDNTIHTRCFAHCNELVFKDATSLSPLISEAQDLCEDLYVLVGVSPKRVLLFENIQKEIADSSECFSDILRLKNLSRTRWTTRRSADQLDQQLKCSLRKPQSCERRCKHCRKTTASLPSVVQNHVVCLIKFGRYSKWWLCTSLQIYWKKTPRNCNPHHLPLKMQSIV
jgi:hypothetical protein